MVLMDSSIVSFIFCTYFMLCLWFSNNKYITAKELYVQKSHRKFCGSNVFITPLLQAFDPLTKLIFGGASAEPLAVKPVAGSSVSLKVLTASTDAAAS